MPDPSRRDPPTRLSNTLTLLVPTPGHHGTHPPTAALALEALPGVLEVTINPRTHTAFVRCDPRQLDLDQLHAAIAAASTRPMDGSPAPQHEQAQAG